MTARGKLRARQAQQQRRVGGERAAGGGLVMFQRGLGVASIQQCGAQAHAVINGGRAVECIARLAYRAVGIDQLADGAPGGPRAARPGK
jgi:hypothetical protein